MSIENDVIQFARRLDRSNLTNPKPQNTQPAVAIIQLDSEQSKAFLQDPQVFIKTVFSANSNGTGV